MKKLTDQEFSSLVLGLNRSIDTFFANNAKRQGALIEASYKLNETTGSHYLTLTVAVVNKDSGFASDKELEHLGLIDG